MAGVKLNSLIQGTIQLYDTRILIPILRKLADTLVVPKAVAQEIEDGPEDDPAKQWLRTSGKQWVKDIGNVVPVISAWDLGVGKTEVLSWAYQHHTYQVVVDDPGR